MSLTAALMRSLKLVVFFTAKSLVRLSWRPIFPACPSVVSVWRSGRESIRRFERQVVDLQWEQGQEEVQLQEQGSWCRSMSVELLGEGIDRWLLLPSLCPSGQVRRGQNHYLHSSRWWSMLLPLPPMVTRYRVTDNINIPFRILPNYEENVCVYCGGSEWN